MQIIQTSSIVSVLKQRVTRAGMLLLVAAATGGAQSTTAGVTLTMRMTIDSGGTSPKTEMTVRQQIAGHRLRMEYTSVSGSAALAAAQGMYTIFSTDDSTMTSVMPAQRMATTMSPNAMGAAAPSFTESLTVNKVEDLGPGESILGHPTRHYRMTTVGTMEMSMMGETCTTPINAVSEQWIAPDLDMAAVTDAIRNQFGSNRPGANFKRTGVTATQPQGAPLRSIAKSQRMGPDGKPTTVTSTHEVVEFVQGPVDAAVFAAPAGFQVMDMRTMMASMPPGAMEAAAKGQVAALCRSMGGS